MKKQYLKMYARKSISAFLALSLLCFLPAGNIHAADNGGYGTDWPLLTSANTLGSTARDDYSGVAATDDGYIAVGVAGSDADLEAYNTKGKGIITGYTDNANTPEVSWVKSLSSTKITDRTKKSTGATTHTETANGDFLYNDICRLCDGSYIVTGGCSATTFTDSTTDTSSTHTVITCTLKDNEGNPYTIDNWIDSKGYYNGILIHLNSSGNIMDIQALGGTADDQINTVSATSDGGFIVSGTTHSTDGDFTGITPADLTNQSVGTFVAKYSSSFAKEWNNYYPNVSIQNVKQTSDGGYLMAGYTNSSLGSTVTLEDSSGNKVTSYDLGDAIIFKTAADGSIRYIKRAGGSDTDSYNNIIPTSDGGYLAVGESSSKDHDMADASGTSLRRSGNTITDGIITTKGTDVIIAKYASDGSREWFKNYGGTAPVNTAYSVVQKADGSYIVFGITNSQDGDIANADTSNSGGTDSWLLAVTSDGTLSHSTLLGGAGEEDIVRGSNHLIDTGTKYVIVGETASNDGAFEKNNGNYDAFIATFSYDYDNDGVPNSLDYYPKDATLHYPPSGALDPVGTAAKTAGDSSKESVSISSKNLLTADNGSALTASDMLGVRTANASFNIPLGLMYYLLNENNIENVVFDAKVSHDKVSTASGENFVTSFELNMTDENGNPLAKTSFGGNILVTFNIPASQAAGYDLAKSSKLYYIASNGTREEISGASFVKNSNGSLTVTFQTSHFSTYAVIQTAVSATVVNTSSNTDNSNTLGTSPGTGDTSSDIYLWIMVAGAFGILSSLYLIKRSGKFNRV